MKELNIKYLIWTFGIVLICWGSCVALGFNGISLANSPLLYIPYMLGGFSPTIASFIALKQSGRVKSFKEWVKGIFSFKHNPLIYLFVIAFSIVSTLLQCQISGYEQIAPLYFILLFLPQMLVGGGLEEVGWRHVLQPELEKRFKFTFSPIIVALIWWLWHLPLFFIEGTWQYERSFWAFGISVLGLSFALAAIKRKTNSTWLCILFHTITNALGGIYAAGDSILGSVVSTAALIIIALVWVKIDYKKNPSRAK